MRKSILIAVATVTLLVAACGSGGGTPSSVTNATRGPGVKVLQIAKGTPAVTINATSTPSAWVGLVDKSTVYAAENVTLIWTLYDDERNQLGRQGTYIGYIEPYSEFDATAIWPAPDPLVAPGSVSVRVVVGKWAKPPAYAGDIHSLGTSSISPTDDGTGNYTFTATMHSSWRKNLKSVPAWAYCTDDQGAFDGSSTITINSIPARGSARASFPVLPGGPGGEPVNCFAVAAPQKMPT